MNADAQVHSKFKLFSGTLDEGAISRDLAGEVEEFARRASAAPKSIGVEYLEHERRVVLSLGYRDDEAPYPIRLESVSLGKVAELGAAELARLEKQMGEAAAKHARVICHELLVTAEREFIMVFMTRAS